MNAGRSIATVAVVAAVAMGFGACSSPRPESPQKPAILQALDPWAEFITDVTQQSEITAVVETTLSSTDDLDYGPAIGMCDTIAITDDLDPVEVVIIESAGGKTMRSCLVGLD
jgi:hypothetical protein